MPTTSLVDELIQLAQDEDTPLPELLRRTRVLATKLKIPELEAWVKKETSGYSGTINELPAYRRIPCELKGLNRVRGWVPVIISDEGEFAEHFRTAYIHQPVAEIKSLLESSNTLLMATLSPEEHVMLAQLNPILGTTEVVRAFGKASLNGVLEAIRNRVLEAALELDAKGIHGEGLSFSEEEKHRAANVTHNIGAIIYGDNANVASPVNSPQSATSAASGSALIEQNLTTIKESNHDLAEAFKKLLDALKADATLNERQKAEAEQQLAFLAEQAAKRPEARQPKSILNAIMAGVFSVLSVSADLAQLWTTVVPVIAGALIG
jgi:hypothetical protein